MTKLSSAPAVLVAIDMAKNRHEVLIRRPERGRRGRMTVLATKSDYDGLTERLATIGKPVIVGFEATGNYHRTLAHRLPTAGFERNSAWSSMMRIEGCPMVRQHKASRAGIASHADQSVRTIPPGLYMP